MFTVIFCVTWRLGTSWGGLTLAAANKANLAGRTGIRNYPICPSQPIAKSAVTLKTAARTILKSGSCPFANINTALKTPRTAIIGLGFKIAGLGWIFIMASIAAGTAWAFTERGALGIINAIIRTTSARAIPAWSLVAAAVSVSARSIANTRLHRGPLQTKIRIIIAAYLSIGWIITTAFTNCLALVWTKRSRIQNGYLDTGRWSRHGILTVSITGLITSNPATILINTGIILH